MPFVSERLPHALPNRLAVELASLRAAGMSVVDLTASNPTRVGIAYPEGLLSPLASTAALTYTPEPLGLASARRAVADDHARRGAKIDPADVVLTASTSEAYSWVFKLFCNPGDAVLVPRPSYPLFEHLARLEGVRLETYDLEWHGRWDLDIGRIRRPSEGVRAVIVVTPNNPTGSCVSPAEATELALVCAERGWALIADEVFADYLLEPGNAVRDLAADAGCLTLSLGGLSKTVGLPQLKLGWIVVGGPPDTRAEVLSGLEIIADSFLSVSTPVQLALPHLLSEGASIRRAIHDRLRENLSAVRACAAALPQIDVPTVEGGWSAVVRVPATRTEESLVLELLRRHHILVYPGFFFDFAREAYLVVSLLVPPDVLRSALPVVFRTAAS